MFDVKVIKVILKKLLELEYTTTSQLEKLTGLEKKDLHKYLRKFRGMGIESKFKIGFGYFIENKKETKAILREVETRNSITKKDFTVNLENIKKIMENNNGIELEPREALILIKNRLNIKSIYGEEDAQKYYWQWRKEYQKQLKNT